MHFYRNPSLPFPPSPTPPPPASLLTPTYLAAAGLSPTSTHPASHLPHRTPPPSATWTVVIRRRGGPTTVEARRWRWHVEARRRISPDLALISPEVAGSGPDLTGGGRIWPGSRRRWPDLARISPVVAQIWADGGVPAAASLSTGSD
jgi:hypothetical protein